MKFLTKSRIIFGLLIFITLFLIYLTKFAHNYPIKNDLKHKPDYFGVTYSKKFCTEIGLDWKEVYAATLYDLNVKEIRLPIYWDDIERQEGVFDFTDYDYLINEGAKNNVNFIISIGWRLPRWPECHAPQWAKDKPLEETRADTLKMLDVVVNHYKDNKAVVSWQLENEPFFNYFGVCPPYDEKFFKSELDLVKSLDNRKVLVSAPGELSLWRKEAKYADIFGTTVYRVVWSSWGGYFRYIFPAWSYGLKADLAGIKPERRVVIELQAEPWAPKGSLTTLPEKEANKSLNIEQFRANLQYAINIDFDKTYLWGLEWWYYKAKNGDDSYWQLAKTLFN